MKILQLTFHCSTNYGAILQTYALGVVLKRLGHHVKLLNLRPLWMSPVWPGYRPGSWIIRFKFHSFTKKYLPLMTPCLRDSSKLAEQCKYSDAVVVGSDQVWNPEITRHFAAEYFLKFVPTPVRRIAYATSFGIMPSEWLVKFDDGHYAEYLKAFHAISVRETSAVELCKKLTPDVKTQVVLDPTLLLTERDYKLNLNLQDKRYGIVSFKFYQGPAHYSMLEKMALAMNVRVVLLNSHKINGFTAIRRPSPIAWLETIAGASFIVTDSFHATCFAIIFNKEFVVLPANQKRIGRLKSLLELLEIGDRFFSCEDEVLVKLPTLGKINYDRVNVKLQKLREASTGYLIESLS